MQYKTCYEYLEYKIPLAHDYEHMMELYNYIEEPVLNQSSCLIVSVKNRCLSAMIAIMYMLFKFNWSISRSLEYINARKIELEVTK